MRSVKTVAEICNLINCLTADEDLRQDLWVHYLKNNDLDSISLHLEKISNQVNVEEELKESLWSLVENPPSEKLIEVIDNFSDFEKDIVCLLMLGLSVYDIAKHKGINRVRIKQVISVIRYNSHWAKYT